MPEFIILTESFLYSNRPYLSNHAESSGFESVRQVTADDATQACNRFVDQVGISNLACDYKLKHHLYIMIPGGMKLIKVFSFTLSYEEVEEQA